MRDLLRRVPLLADVPDADLDAVARNSQSLWKTKGTRLFEEGSRADCCFVLTAGRAKIVLRTSGDSEPILGLVEPYALIGEIALLDNARRSAGLVAVEKSHFIRIPAATFLGLRNTRRFEDKLVAHVTATVRRTTAQLRAIYTYNSFERVLWALGTVARQRGVRSGTEIAITPKPTHQDLADMTGCTRETVTRVLLQLRDLKCARWENRTLHLQASAVRGDGPTADDLVS